MQQPTSLLTTKQGMEFMIKLKTFNKDDFEKCQNIVDLLVKSVLSNKSIDHSKCKTFSEINKDSNKT